MRSVTLALIGLFGVVARGAGMAFLEEGVGRADPLSFVGWWALGFGAVLSFFAFPKSGAWRATLPAVAFAALGLGLTATALSTIGTAATATLLLVSLAVGPAIARAIAGSMPHATHFGGVVAALLGVLAVVPMTVDVAAASVALLAGLAFTGQVMATQRFIGSHPVIAFAGATFLLAGAALVASSWALGAPLMPPTDSLLVLSAAVLVTGAGAFLARVRAKERLGWILARRLLPLQAVAAVLVAAALGSVSIAVWTALGVFVLGAWVAGIRPTTISEAETITAGP